MCGFSSHLSNMIKLLRKIWNAFKLTEEHTEEIEEELNNKRDSLNGKTSVIKQDV